MAGFDVEAAVDIASTVIAVAAVVVVCNPFRFVASSSLSPAGGISTEREGGSLYSSWGIPVFSPSPSIGRQHRPRRGPKRAKLIQCLKLSASEHRKWTLLLLLQSGVLCGEREIEKEQCSGWRSLGPD